MLRIIIENNNLIIAEGFRSVKTFTNKLVLLEDIRLLVSISGNNLSIIEMGCNEIRINGNIDNINYIKR